MGFLSDWEKRVEDLTQRGIPAQFLKNLEATIAGIGGERPYVSPAQGAGEQVAGFLGRAVPEVAVATGVEALTAGLGTPALLAGALGAGAAGALGGAREAEPLKGAAIGAATGAAFLGAGKLLGPLFRRAATGDSGAFREAAVALGSTPEEAGAIIKTVSRGAEGKALPKRLLGGTFTQELERLQGAPAEVAGEVGPHVPTTPAEAASYVRELKNRFLQIGKETTVSTDEAARLAAGAAMRQQLIAAAKRDLPAEAAAHAEKHLPNLFAGADRETLAILQETVEDLEPHQISRLAAHLSSKPICS